MNDRAKMSAMALQNRYRLTLFIGGSLLLLAIILYGLTSFLAERRALYSDIRAQGEQLKLSLNDTIDVTQSHVFYMRHAVEQTLAHPELSNPSALKSTLRFSSGSPAGSPWENIPKSLETAVGSFHTDPDILLSDRTEQRDMIAALEMMLIVAAAHERHKVFQWSYYYDADMLWFMIYPKLPRAELFRMTGASEMRASLKSFFDIENTAPVIKAGPEKNPSRTPVWTDPYLDFGGKGMMVSLLAPVYLNDRYTGTVGTDVTLENLDKVLAQHPLTGGRTLIVDAGGMLLADSGMSLKGLQKAIRINDVIPDAPSEKLLSAAKSASIKCKDSEWIRYPLRDTSWTLLVQIHKKTVTTGLLKTLRPYLAMSIVLVAAITGLSWLQNRRYIRPALQLAEYVDQVENDPETPPPALPSIWQRWFTTVAQSARERQKLNRSLEEKVTEAVVELRHKDQLLLQQHRHTTMGSLLTNIAHQWRQPLNNVSVIIQQLQLSHTDGSLSSESMQRDVQSSMQILKELSRTIDNFRKFYTGSQEPRSFVLEETVREALAIIRPVMTEKGIDLNFKSSDRVSVHGVPGELVQAVVNIIQNSIETLFARNVANPMISVEVASSPTSAVVQIRDNGGGMEDDVLPRIFDPYFTTKFASSGVGMGLYMTRMVIEQQMQGQIDAGNMGEGACFTIVLPKG